MRSDMAGNEKRQPAGGGLDGVSKYALRELMSLKHPPQMVKDIVCASCLLLGHPIRIAYEWKKQVAVLKSIMTDGVVIPDTISPDALAKAKDELKNTQSAEVVRNKSLAIESLYNWTQQRLKVLESN